MKWNKKTEMIVGSVTGILLPFLVLIILHAVRFHNYSLGEFFHRIIKLKIAGNFLSLCAIPNLLLFFIFLWLNKLNASKGVIGATLLLTIVIMIYKFI